MAGVKRRADFFEITVSPTTQPKKSRESDPDPPQVLTLGPFALPPKVFFHNVKVNTLTTSVILLRNPSDSLVEVEFELSEDLIAIGLQCNSLNFNIPATSTETLEIKWEPKKVIEGRGKVTAKHINGNKKFSYISVSCTSVDEPKKKAINKKPKAINNEKKLFSTDKRLEIKSNQNVGSSTRHTKRYNYSSRTPVRRETYEVLKPTFNTPGLTPIIKVRSPVNQSFSFALDKDIESSYNQTKIVSSSPQSKGNDGVKVPREPLKEFNYNTRPLKMNSPSKSIKMENFMERIKRERFISDSIFDETEINFDRDSLDAPDTCKVNPSLSPTLDNMTYSFGIHTNIYLRNNEDAMSKSSFSSLVEFPNSEFVSAKKEKPFYLTDNITPNTSTFTQNTSSEIPDCFTQDHCNVSLDFTSKQSEQEKLESMLLTPSLANINDIPANDSVSGDKFLSIRESETKYFDITFPIVDLSPKMEPNISQLTHYISIQEPVSFNISPARPVFQRSTSKITGSKFRKVRIGKESSEEVKNKTVEPNVFSVLESEKYKMDLYHEPEYLIHPYGITSIPNPFAKNAIHPREWLEKLELELIKWLNSLLTPPIEFGSIVKGVDVKKLWNQSTASALKIAPSREAASNDYVLSDGSHMTALRKAALTLAQSHQFKSTIYNIHGKIDSGFLSVKDDISLYQNQGARVKLVQMCMYYNPLWLRIALEVMYEQYIPLQQSNIHRGLVYFLKNYLLSDYKIVDKHKTAKSTHPHGPAFMIEMNNFIVLKFLTLVYFLDLAKMKKIVPYDPCLFCKDSPIKDSEGMLNEFVKEFLKCVGQFKKTLKAIGYKLEYSQTFLHEFDYGLTSHLDLRDGVRLTRAMETILKDPSYSNKLLTPVTSRLQKIHNVQVAFSAMKDCGLVINGVVPHDVVNGHREKIFSLIWQILHDFLAPRYQSSAKVIQVWWRKIYFKVLIEKRIATRKNVIKVQSYVRRFLAKKRIEKMNSSAVLIQRWYRKHKIHFKERAIFLRLKFAAIKVQTWYRSILEMRTCKKNFLLFKQSAITIQNYYRSYAVMKLCRDDFRRKKEAALKIQRWIRNLAICRKDRQYFLSLKRSATKVQERFRAILLAKHVRKHYLMQRAAVIRIQAWYCSRKTCKEARIDFLRHKNAAFVIQRAFRSYQLTKTLQKRFTEQKKSAVLIQRFFRKYLVIKKYRNSFLEKKKAAITIQKWYRQVILFRRERQRYLLILNASVVIQRWFRIKLLTITERREFLLKKKAATKIQRWYRELVRIRKNKEMMKFLNAIIYIQAYYRGYRARKDLKIQMHELAKKKEQRQARQKGPSIILSELYKTALLTFDPQYKKKDLGELVNAYSNMDICTTFSPLLCLQLRSSEPFFEQLWKDLQLSFRFGPYLDIFRHGLNIIIKLLKFPDTTEFLIQTIELYDGYETLVLLMGKFLEKNTEIFCKAATILWILLASPNCDQVKQRIEARLRFYHKKIMSKKGDKPKKFIPSKEADWGYFGKPIAFVSSKTASEELIKLLT